MKDIGKKQQTRLEILQKWIEPDQDLESANAKQSQGQQENGGFGGGEST